MMHKMERHEVAALVDKELAKRDAKIEALEQQVSILRERIGWIDEHIDGGYR